MDGPKAYNLIPLPNPPLLNTVESTAGRTVMDELGRASLHLIKDPDGVSDGEVQEKEEDVDRSTTTQKPLPFSLRLILDPSNIYNRTSIERINFDWDTSMTSHEIMWSSELLLAECLQASCSSRRAVASNMLIILLTRHEAARHRLSKEIEGLIDLAFPPNTIQNSRRASSYSPPSSHIFRPIQVAQTFEVMTPLFATEMTRHNFIDRMLRHALQEAHLAALIIQHNVVRARKKQKAIQSLPADIRALYMVGIKAIGIHLKKRWRKMHDLVPRRCNGSNSHISADILLRTVIHLMRPSTSSSLRYFRLNRRRFVELGGLIMLRQCLGGDHISVGGKSSANEEAAERLLVEISKEPILLQAILKAQLVEVVGRKLLWWSSCRRPSSSHRYQLRSKLTVLLKEDPGIDESKMASSNTERLLHLINIMDLVFMNACLYHDYLSSSQSEARRQRMPFLSFSNFRPEEDYRTIPSSAADMVEIPADEETNTLAEKIPPLMSAHLCDVRLIEASLALIESKTETLTVVVATIALVTRMLSCGYSCDLVLRQCFQIDHSRGACFLGRVMTEAFLQSTNGSYIDAFLKLFFQIASSPSGKKLIISKGLQKDLRDYCQKRQGKGDEVFVSSLRALLALAAQHRRGNFSEQGMKIRNEACEQGMLRTGNDLLYSELFEVIQQQATLKQVIGRMLELEAYQLLLSHLVRGEADRTLPLSFDERARRCMVLYEWLAPCQMKQRLRQKQALEGLLSEAVNYCSAFIALAVQGGEHCCFTRDDNKPTLQSVGLRAAYLSLCRLFDNNGFGEAARNHVWETESELGLLSNSRLLLLRFVYKKVLDATALESLLAFLSCFAPIPAYEILSTSSVEISPSFSSEVKVHSRIRTLCRLFLPKLLSFLPQSHAYEDNTLHLVMLILAKLATTRKTCFLLAHHQSNVLAFLNAMPTVPAVAWELLANLSMIEELRVPLVRQGFLQKACREVKSVKERTREEQISIFRGKPHLFRYLANSSMRFTPGIGQTNDFMVDIIPAICRVLRETPGHMRRLVYFSTVAVIYLLRDASMVEKFVENGIINSFAVLIKDVDLPRPILRRILEGLSLIAADAARRYLASLDAAGVKECLFRVANTPDLTAGERAKDTISLRDLSGEILHLFDRKRGMGRQEIGKEQAYLRRLVVEEKEENFHHEEGRKLSLEEGFQSATTVHIGKRQSRDRKHDEHRWRHLWKISPTRKDHHSEDKEIALDMKSLYRTRPPPLALLRQEKR